MFDNGQMTQSSPLIGGYGIAVLGDWPEFPNEAICFMHYMSGDPIHQ